MKFTPLLRLCALFAFLAMSFGLAFPVWAHAELVSASPAPGASVPPTLAEIRLTFNEPLSPGSTFELLTDNFQTVPGLAPDVEGSVVWDKLGAPLAVGRYTVQWKAVGDDGHTVEGSYPFSVSAETHSTLTPWPVIGLVVLVLVGVGTIGLGLYRRRPTADSRIN